MGKGKGPFLPSRDAGDPFTPLPAQLITGVAPTSELLLPSASTKAPCINVRAVSLL